MPVGYHQFGDYYVHLLSGALKTADGDLITPFQATDRRLQQWALKEEMHCASSDWQPLMNESPPIDGPECVYDLRRLAHLAMKWVVISSFDSAERKEHEPIRFSGSQVTITTQPQQHNDNNTTTTTTQ
jgi:hypothetical protein